MIKEEIDRKFKENGFQIDGDSFVLEKVIEDHHYIINGVPQKKRIRFEMEYIGEGAIMDDCDSSDADEVPVYGFDIYNEKHEVELTIYIKDFDDFLKFINI